MPNLASSFCHLLTRSFSVFHYCTFVRPYSSVQFNQHTPLHPQAGHPAGQAPFPYAPLLLGITKKARPYTHLVCSAPTPTSTGSLALRVRTMKHRHRKPKNVEICLPDSLPGPEPKFDPTIWEFCWRLTEAVRKGRTCQVEF
jgi:hypothetical protein